MFVLPVAATGLAADGAGVIFSTGVLICAFCEEASGREEDDTEPAEENEE